MNTTEKKEFLKKLIQEDDAALAITLQNFRENADFEVLPNVLELLASPRSQDIKDYITNLCSQIRSQDAAFIVFDFMMQTSLPDVKKNMLAALWQTGLDFSDKIHSIVSIIKECNDFETMLEAFTLLENCTDKVNTATAAALRDDMVLNLPSIASHLKPLYTAAIENLGNKKVIPNAFNITTD
jgi:hypothetical protein